MSQVIISMLPIETGSTSQAQVSQFIELKRCAARVLDGESQSQILEEAGNGIKEAILDINLRKFYMVGSEKQADVNLVDGTDSYALSTADFGGMREVQLIDTDGNPYRTLQYVKWENFNQAVMKQTETGTPKIWTAHNLFGDLQIQVYPTPTADDATNYDLRITHFERIPKPSSDSDVIAYPQELEGVLCAYGRYHLCLWRNDRRWEHYYALYVDRLQKFGVFIDQNLNNSRDISFRLDWGGGYANEYNPLDD